jgi:MerR family transcriptional regulator, redox-sensitive transcriptional activator SoxR
VAGDLLIGEVARRAEIAASAVRYYEQVGVLPEARRVNGRRLYDEQVFGRLAVIALLQQAGFTVAEMRTFLHDFPAGTPPSDRWRALAEKKLPEVEARIARAETMKQILQDGLLCRCPTIEECARLMQGHCGNESGR